LFSQEILCEKCAMTKINAISGEMPYKCTDCGKGFAVKERLRLHQRTHTGERPYQCEHCDKSFARGGQLMVHRRMHTGDKPYACPEPGCGLRFTSSGNLKTHAKLHVGAREFKCKLCDKAYPRADTLKRHILSFHENKRLYKCDICNKSFKVTACISILEISNDTLYLRVTFAIICEPTPRIRTESHLDAPDAVPDSTKDLNSLST